MESDAFFALGSTESSRAATVRRPVAALSPMKRAVAIALSGAVLLAGCGEDFPPPPPEGDTAVDRYRERRQRQVDRELEAAAIRDRAERRRERTARIRRERTEDRARAAEEAESCDPNYSGCVPPLPAKVDCADVDEADKPLRVKDEDPHGLDRDGDRVACEPQR